MQIASWVKKKIDLKQNKKQSHKVHYCYNSDFFFFFYNASAKSSTVGSKFVMFEGEKNKTRKCCCCHSVYASSLLKGL